MTNLFDRSLDDGRNVADVLLSAARRENMHLNFVDIGARNGSFILPHGYAAACRLVGFEPNPVEYEKLTSGTTDAARVGMREPKFRDRLYFSKAVWREAAERELHVPIGPGAATLMGPAHVGITRNMWRGDFDRGQTYYDKVQVPSQIVKISCDSMDNIWRDEADLIDVMKVDVEGAELAVFEGARHLLADQKILFIRAEFMLTPYYRDHFLLGHQQVFLDGYNYRLVALDIDHAQYSWKSTTLPQDLDRRFLYAGDAFYMLDPDLNRLDPVRQYRLGLACIAFGYYATGLSLIRESGMISEADLDYVEGQASKKSFMRRLREAWEEVPHLAYRLLQK